MEESTNTNIKVESSQEITPHTKAVYDAGSNLLKESISTGRDYCKNMITTSLSAIPIYIALIKLYIPDKMLISNIIDFSWLMPIIFFLIASIIFSFGYLPGHSVISLEYPDKVQNLLDKAIKRRFYLGIIGFLLLVLGISDSIFILVSLTK